MSWYDEWDDYCEENDISPLDDDYDSLKTEWECENNPLSDDYVPEKYGDENW